MINLVQRMDDVIEAMTERHRSLLWLLGGGRYKLHYRLPKRARVLGQLFRNDRDRRRNARGFGRRRPSEGRRARFNIHGRIFTSLMRRPWLFVWAAGPNGI